jgi:hypothetical protein
MEYAGREREVKTGEKSCDHCRDTMIATLCDFPFARILPSDRCAPLCPVVEVTVHGGEVVTIQRARIVRKLELRG